jgi:alcohol dehydrogenase
MKADVYRLRKFISPEIIFGVGSRHMAGKYCRNYHGRKVMLVSDRGVERTGWLRDVQESLEAENIPYISFNNFSPNPRAEEVMEGADLFLRNNCDVIVALGGGSPMDGAKGIGIVASNGNHILDFKGVNRINHPLPPTIFIPTTAGTSADVSQFAIINDSENRVKIAVVSKIIIPDVALIDPETTLTMDSYLTACTGMDALVHAMEAFVSIAHSPLTDTHALEAIRILSSHLRDVTAHPDDLGIREKIMFGSLEAGLAFSNALLGNVHAMAHSLGGFLDLPHGECNSLLLEHVMNFNYPTSQERYTTIARSCGLETDRRTSGEIRDLLFGYIRNLRYDLGIKKTLRDCGVTAGDIPVLAAKAYEDACLITNPRRSNRRDLETIYEEAY